VEALESSGQGRILCVKCPDKTISDLAMTNAPRPSGIEYYTGFDGGGTYTRVLVEDHLGNEVFHSRGAGCNVFKLGIELAIQNITQLVQQISHQVPDYQRCAGRACLGLAGITEGNPPSELVVALSEIGIGPAPIVHNDAYLSWYSIARGEPAIALVSGTGSVAFGIDESGEVITSGGYGYLYADEGSGFDIGASGVRAAILAFEHRGPSTGLLEALLAECKLKHIAELTDCLNDPQSVARFAPVVHEQAKRGDKEAIRIITDAARDLALLLKSVRERGDFRRDHPVKIAMFGGCLNEMELLRKQVEGRIANLGMAACTAHLSPEQAAVEIARSARQTRSSN
jgi:N-acetylglucosamine kinase-like BadF-type ATPase